MTSCHDFKPLCLFVPTFDGFFDNLFRFFHVTLMLNFGRNCFFVALPPTDRVRGCATQPTCKSCGTLKSNRRVCAII